MTLSNAIGSSSDAPRCGNDRSQFVLLVSDHLEATIAPHLGGGLLALDAKFCGAKQPLLRSASFEVTNPRDLAFYPLVPWANLIYGRGIGNGADFIRLDESEPGLLLHGYGWRSSWRIRSQETHCCELKHSRRLREKGYAYDASLNYGLAGTSLTITLTVTNRAAIAMPFGLGFHPFFPRLDSTRVAIGQSKTLAIASCLGGLMRQDAFPDARWRPIEVPAKKLLTDWNGKYSVFQPELGHRVDVWASDPTNQLLQYYAPLNEHIFCLEPVSHAVNSFNDFPGADLLEPGATLSAMMVLQARPNDRGFRQCGHFSTQSNREDEAGPALGRNTGCDQ